MYIMLEENIRSNGTMGYFDYRYFILPLCILQKIKQTFLSYGCQEEKADSRKRLLVEFLYSLFHGGKLSIWVRKILNKYLWPSGRFMTSFHWRFRIDFRGRGLNVTPHGPAYQSTPCNTELHFPISTVSYEYICSLCLLHCSHFCTTVQCSRLNYNNQCSLDSILQSLTIAKLSLVDLEQYWALPGTYKLYATYAAKAPHLLGFRLSFMLYIWGCKL